MPDGEQEADELWEYRKRDLFRKARESNLGGQFWAEVDIDPDADPALLTEEQVTRLEDALSAMEKLYPQAFIPYYRKEWERIWAVPQPTRWRDVLIKYTPRSETELGWRGLYRWRVPGIQEESISLTKEGIAPGTIAHEMAHKRYFALSPEMRAEVDKILDWYERTSPAFRQYTMGQGTPEWRKHPAERHAMIYEWLGRRPERIPYYLDRYYEGLKPWEIGAGLGARRWALQQGLIAPEEFYQHPWEREMESVSSWRSYLQGLARPLEPFPHLLHRRR